MLGTCKSLQKSAVWLLLYFYTLQNEKIRRITKWPEKRVHHWQMIYRKLLQKTIWQVEIYVLRRLVFVKISYNLLFSGLKMWNVFYIYEMGLCLNSGWDRVWDFMW